MIRPTILFSMGTWNKYIIQGNKTTSVIIQIPLMAVRGSTAVASTSSIASPLTVVIVMFQASTLHASFLLQHQSRRLLLLLLQRWCLRAFPLHLGQSSLSLLLWPSLPPVKLNKRLNELCCAPR